MRALATLGVAIPLAACGSGGDAPKAPAEPSALVTQSMHALRDSGCFRVGQSSSLKAFGNKEIRFSGEIDGERVKGEWQVGDVKEPLILIGKTVYQYTRPQSSRDLQVEGWFENDLGMPLAAPGVTTLSDIMFVFKGASDVTSEPGPKVGEKATTALRYSLPHGDTVRVLIAGNNEGPPLRIEVTSPTSFGTINLGPFGLTCSISRPAKVIDLEAETERAAAEEG